MWHQVKLRCLTFPWQLSWSFVILLIIGSVRKQRAQSHTPCAFHFKFEWFSFPPVGSTPHRTAASPPIGWLHRRRSRPSSLPPLSPHIRWADLCDTCERKWFTNNYTGMRKTKRLLRAFRLEILLLCGHMFLKNGQIWREVKLWWFSQSDDVTSYLQLIIWYSSFPNEGPLDMTSVRLRWTCSKCPTVRSHYQRGSSKMASMSCDGSQCLWQTIYEPRSRHSYVFFIYNTMTNKHKAKKKKTDWRFTCFKPN